MGQYFFLYDCGEEENFFPSPGFKPRTVHRVMIRYTDYIILASTLVIKLLQFSKTHSVFIVMESCKQNNG